jgi:hypothetical protein
LRRVSAFSSNLVRHHASSPTNTSGVWHGASSSLLLSP